MGENRTHYPHFDFFIILKKFRVSVRYME